MMILGMLAMILYSGLLRADLSQNGCMRTTFLESAVRRTGVVQQNAYNTVLVKTISPSDLVCYPYVIDKPGSYVLTRDFEHVTQTAKNGQPLIRILSDNVTIDLHTFSLYQNIPADQLDGTNPVIRSNLIEIGDGTTSVHNVTIQNGTLSGVAGMGILIYPNVSTVLIRSVQIVNCLAGGFAMSGAHDISIDSVIAAYNGNNNIAGTLNGTYLDATLFPFSTSCSNAIGAFGCIAYNCSGIMMHTSEILNAGTSSLTRDVFGIYYQNCTESQFDNCISSGHKSQDGNVRPVALYDCSQIIFDHGMVLNNDGFGIVGIDLVRSNTIDIAHCLISRNSSHGVFMTSGAVTNSCVLPAICIPLSTRCDVCDPFVATGNSVDFVQAYTDYKAGLTIKSDAIAAGATQVNWQSLVDPALWTTFMDAAHAIFYTLESYTSESQAYGIRLFHTNNTMISDSCIDYVQADSNSSWGILVDANSCSTTVGGNNNTISCCTVQNVVSFGATTAPNITYNAEIEVMFGDILNGAPNYTVKTGETISMLGRAVGIELSDCCAGTVLTKNNIQNIRSLYVQAYGIFLNRSNRSEIDGNSITSVIGSDVGFGLMIRNVNTTDLVVSSLMFANGYSNSTAYDLNNNYAAFWNYFGGTLSVQHGFTSDVTILNNLGVYENVQILFDNQTVPSLTCTISNPDIATAYIV